MKSLSKNTIKVGLGFFAGLILLYFIHTWNFVIITIIQTIFFIGFYTCIDKILNYFSENERDYRKNNPKWFRKTYNKYKKLTKKEEITYLGIGCLPIDKNGNWNKEASILLTELFEYEPFLDFVREELGVDKE